MSTAEGSLREPRLRGSGENYDDEGVIARLSQLPFAMPFTSRTGSVLVQLERPFNTNSY